MKRQEELSKWYNERYNKNITVNNIKEGWHIQLEGPKEDMLEFTIPKGKVIDKQELAKIRLMLMSLYN